MNLTQKFDKLAEIIATTKNGEMTVSVSGYWVDDKTEFVGYTVVVGGCSVEDDDDEDIFYYFNTFTKFKSAFNVADNTDFVLTDVYISESYFPKVEPVPYENEPFKVIEYPLLSIRQEGKLVGNVGYVGAGADRKIATEGLIGVHQYDDFVELIKGLQGNNIMIDDFFW